jgi:Flp pilus assembly protein TadG
MKQQTAAFISDRSGNFAMVMSVSTVVLLAIAGFAVNTISVDHEQAALQDALDGAVLAGASLGYSATDRQRIAEAEKFM